MILRLSRAALLDVGALLVDSLRWALLDIGRWITKDDDHLADLGDE